MSDSFSDSDVNYDEFIQEHRNNVSEIFQHAKRNLERNASQRKDRYNAKMVVLLEDTNFKTFGVQQYTVFKQSKTVCIQLFQTLDCRKYTSSDNYTACDVNASLTLRRSLRLRDKQRRMWD